MKFATLALIGTAAAVNFDTMNEDELSAYCRRKGIYAEQINGWKRLCIKANCPIPTKENKATIRRQVKENRLLAILYG